MSTLTKAWQRAVIRNAHGGANPGADPENIIAMVQPHICTPECAGLGGHLNLGGCDAKAFFYVRFSENDEIPYPVACEHEVLTD